MAERDDDYDDPDAPASAEEVAASERLRDALASAGAAPAGADVTGGSPEVVLALALRAAWDPTALGADENRAVVDATPSAEELELAARLRDGLAGEPDSGASEGAAALQLAKALRSAFSPSGIDATEHRAIVDAALAKMANAAPSKTETKGADVLVLRRRTTAVRVAFGFVTGGLALAASIVFVVTSAPVRSPEAPLAKARTTQPLFSEPFKPGETSARIDRIASARASDFRDNRFSKWGVR